MTKFTLPVAIALLSVAQLAVAQGDPEATTDLNRNQPTKSWTQWQPKATYAISQLPDQYMGSNRIQSGEGGQPGGEPQSGYNTCASDAWNQDSMCQTAYVNSLEDFCIWGPAEYGTIGEKERSGVAYCTTDKHGTRLIPDGSITGAHFVRTRDYVQVTGVGDFTSMLIPQGDDGGEFDPHGADDLGNPIGGVLYTTANPESNGRPAFISEWTNFMSWNQFCIRACWGEQAAAQCQHIYDVLGCQWNLPANYEAGTFESCDGDVAMLQGIYSGSTFRQGDPVTPSAHPAPSSSQCSTTNTLRHGLLAASGVAASSSSTSTTSSSESSATSSAATSTGSVASATAAAVNSASRSGANASSSASAAANAAASGSSNATNGASSLLSSLSIATAASGLVAVVAMLAL